VREELPPYWDCRLKVFVHFSAKVMANLYRKKSCLHLGDVAFRRFNGRKDARPCSLPFTNRNLTNNKPGASDY
jgi:hypothetical protein